MNTCRTFLAIIVNVLLGPVICLTVNPIGVLSLLHGLTGEIVLCFFPGNQIGRRLVDVSHTLLTACTDLQRLFLCDLVDPAALCANSSTGELSTTSANQRPTNPPEIQRIVDSPLQMQSTPSFVVGLRQSGFTYQELEMATNGFSDENFLGAGGFGYVHKGVLIDGREVAVKQLKAEGKWGEREFMVEVDVLSRVHHRHVVQLTGCCTTHGKRILVFEFVPNKTLDFHLHGSNQSTLDWPTRMKISLGAAKGLAYLHEECTPRIIHRDIKAANILLDNTFDAKVGDFGLAKLFPDGNTHVFTNAIMGTHGYLAPEYANKGEVREKSDTFSFGVVLLELITGKKPIFSIPTSSPDSFPYKNLVDWARPLLEQAMQDGNYDAFVDARLQNNYSSDEMKRMVSCAAACVRMSPQDRPSMSQIVLVLGGLLSPDNIIGGQRSQYSGHITTESIEILR